MNRTHKHLREKIAAYLFAATGLTLHYFQEFFDDLLIVTYCELLRMAKTRYIGNSQINQKLKILHLKNSIHP